MGLALVLLSTGLLAVFLEFFMPGGILAAAGALLIMGSLIVFASQSDSLLITTLYFAAVGVSVALLIKFALWFISHGKAGSSIYSSSDQEGFVASAWDRSCIGKEGVVHTDLKPGGHVVIDGKRYQAISQSGYISKGDSVRIVGGEGESLMVKRLVLKDRKEKIS